MRLVAKHHQVGYQTPGERPGCRNCAHCTQPALAYVAPRSYCGKHGLEVTSGGICHDHKLQRTPSEAETAYRARQLELVCARSDELLSFVPQAGEARA